MVRKTNIEAFVDKVNESPYVINDPSETLIPQSILEYAEGSRNSTLDYCETFDIPSVVQNNEHMVTINNALTYLQIRLSMERQESNEAKTFVRFIKEVAGMVYLDNDELPDFDKVMKSIGKFGC